MHPALDYDVGAINPRARRVLDRLGTKADSSMTTDYHFCYSGLVTGVAQGSSGQIQIKIDGGVDFVAKQVMMVANLNAAATVTGLVPRCPLLRRVGWDFAAVASTLLVPLLTHTRIQIQSNQRPWFNIPMRSDLYTGDMADPAWLPDEVFIAGNDTVLIDCFNDLPDLTGDAAPAVDFFVGLVGIKLGKSRATG